MGESIDALIDRYLIERWREYPVAATSVGVDGSTPKPRKLTNASPVMTPATPSVVATMIGDNEFGTRWRKMIRTSPTPAARAAST